MRLLVRNQKRRPHRAGPGRAASDCKPHVRKYWSSHSYPVFVTQSAAVRLTNFSNWVRENTDQIRADNGWTKVELAKRAGVGRDTIHAWATTDFSGGGPKPDTVLALCQGLGLDPLVAFELLGWVKVPGSRSTEDESPGPEISRELTRVIRDPNVPKAEKRMITDMVSRILAPYRRNGQ